MRRAIASLLGAAALVTMTAFPALAVKPDGQCPTAESGFVLVDQEGWWNETVAGFALAGIPVYVGGDPNAGFTVDFDAFAVGWGFADGQALYEYILGPQWDRLNINGDAYLCLRHPPVNPSNPGYFFTGIDNSAN
ncbi:MAG: hypothetical protein FIA92_08895 [Chloroflexi bacterium]|nr:hypothetical protein [Chloroflexota bacterium]